MIRLRPTPYLFRKLMPKLGTGIRPDLRFGYTGSGIRTPKTETRGGGSLGQMQKTRTFSRAGRSGNGIRG